MPSRDGVELAVHDLGGDGPALLVAHATGLLAPAYRPLAARLAERFHIWGLDFRAHGASTGPVGGDLAWSGMAADVAATVDALGLDGPVAFGHSMGGAALVLAELDRPSTFRALYLYEPVIFPSGFLQGRPNPMVESARRRRLSFPSREVAYANYAAKPPLDELSDESLRAYVAHGFVDQPDGTVTLACRPEDEAATFSAAASAGAFERLGEVDCPVVVARGSIDSPGPSAVAALVADALPRGRLVVLDGLGHFGPLAEEAVVADSVVGSLLAP